jgi:chromosome segregation ATPase
MHHTDQDDTPAPTAALDFGMAQQLQDLAKQLSMQMEYNNELLTQMQGLEEQQLAHQRTAQEKQASLRQALSAVDALRSESADLKRRLAAAQVSLCPRPPWGRA